MNCNVNVLTYKCKSVRVYCHAGVAAFGVRNFLPHISKHQPSLFFKTGEIHHRTLTM